MTRRVYKYINGELTQTDGPPEHRCGAMGFDGMQGDVCEACERIGKVEAPEVVIPVRHRSAG